MSETAILNNKMIAQNTLFLYFRTLLLMVISLYTSRVVLSTLGVEDYGVYNVVGGFVSMFAVISGALSSAVSRFITFELGSGDNERLNRIFSTSVNIQLTIGLLIFILGETVGVWFINYHLNIPPTRIEATNWIFQCSLISFIINLISTPYNATIIAHERMKAFAYVSILEAVLKLAIVYLLLIFDIDKLILYAILNVIVSLIIRLVYGAYCSRNFVECRYRFVYDKSLLKKMTGFACWNFIGVSSAVMRDQGRNIILNIFYSSVVNAAYGIAIQVNNAIQSFVNNFTTAINPQITKSYAMNEYDNMMKLIYKGARYSYYMLLLISLPIIFNTSFILNIWLGIIPEYAVSFVRLVLIFALNEILSSTLITAMLATGKIKNYQIIVGGLQMMNLPLSYLFLYLGYSPNTVFYIAIFVSFCCVIARIYMLRNMIQLSARKFLRNVYFNVIIVTLLACIIPIIILIKFDDNLLRFIISNFSCVLCTTISVLFIGLSNSERKVVVSKLSEINKKIVIQ